MGKKRMKLELCTFNLPDQVLERIQSMSGREAFIQLSCVNKRHRKELEPFVLSQVKCKWYDLAQEDCKKFLERKNMYITQLRIIDCYSYGEWQLDVFELVLNHLPRLHALIVNSFNSSNWLKYRSNLTIRSIDMFTQRSHQESERLFNNPNPKNIRRLSNGTDLPKICSLNHFSGFKNLSVLILDNYHFNWDESPCLLSLRVLQLRNCTWEYPFTPSNLNENNSLVSFELRYSLNNAFLHLERLNKFFSNPFYQDCNIKKIAIITEHSTGDNNLTYRRLDAFLNPNTFPHLREIDFSGCCTSSSQLRTLLDKHKGTSITKLTITVLPSASGEFARFDDYPTIQRIE